MSPEPTAKLYRWEDIPTERLTDSLSRKLVTGQRMMAAHVYLQAGCVVPWHAHENEQFSYVLSGELRFRVGDPQDEGVLVREGEILHIPSGVPHGVVALVESLSLDLFSPPRQDWLDGTDDYLRRSPGS